MRTRNPPRQPSNFQDLIPLLQVQQSLTGRYCHDSPEEYHYPESVVAGATTLTGRYCHEPLKNHEPLKERPTSLEEDNPGIIITKKILPPSCPRRLLLPEEHFQKIYLLLPITTNRVLPSPATNHPRSTERRTYSSTRHPCTISLSHETILPSSCPAKALASTPQPSIMNYSCTSRPSRVLDDEIPRSRKKKTIPSTTKNATFDYQVYDIQPTH